MMRNLISLWLLLIPCLAWPQSNALKIIFDVTSKDTLAHQAVIRHVEGIAASHPDTKLQVVVYGGAISMLTSGKSVIEHKIKQLKTNDNISFKVCSISMKKYGVENDQLVPGVDVVPDAILEIVTKQGQGWGYIKEAY